MTPYYADDWLTVLQGDAREVLSGMPDESVHCVVTSPPYWGLRDYGTGTWEGGDPGCEHKPGRSTSRIGPNAKNICESSHLGSSCPCGAIRQDRQLGLEPTPEEYVANMVALFREVRRVLRRDGTLWLNVGDSYASTPPGNGKGATPGSSTLHGVSSERYQQTLDSGRGTKRSTIVGDLKPKDLVGIPWMLAFALRADGWYLRSDVIWAKPNPMPESVTDRPTKAHEYLFLLSKSARYFYDADAVREPSFGATLHDLTGPRYEAPGQAPQTGSRRSKKPDGWNTAKGGHGSFHPEGREHGEASEIKAGRNLRTVWSIATEPYPGSHFATFPQKLVEPCILAGTSARGVCPECGAPWVRETKVSYDAQGRTTNGPRSTERRHESPGRDVRMVKLAETTGWHPTCRCEPDDLEQGAGMTYDERMAQPVDAAGRSVYPWEPIPATVLDPFAGTGTTLLVAQRHSRRAIGIDLNADYLTQCLTRNAQAPLGLVG